MKTYRVKPEFYDFWYIEEDEDYTVTEEEVGWLSIEWDISKEDIKKQLELIEDK